MKALISDSFSSNLDYINKKSDESMNISVMNASTNSNEDIPLSKDSDKLLDPLCHYNTSLNSKYCCLNLTKKPAGIRMCIKKRISLLDFK